MAIEVKINVFCNDYKKSIFFFDVEELLDYIKKYFYKIAEIVINGIKIICSNITEEKLIKTLEEIR